MTDQTVIVFDRAGDPQTGLQPWEPIAADILLSGSPLHNGHTFFSTLIRIMFCRYFDRGMRRSGPVLRTPSIPFFATMRDSTALPGYNSVRIPGQDHRDVLAE